MKNNSVLRIVLYAILAPVLVGLLIGGLVFDGMIQPVIHLGGSEMESGVTAHSGSIPAESIRELEIQWVAGGIHVNPGTTENIEFSETGSDKYPMVYEVQGSRLILRYAQENKFGIHTTPPAKELSVTVPASWFCDELEVNTVSANLTIEDLTLEDVKVNSVSARCCLQNMTADDITMNSVSGNLEFLGSATEITMEGVSSDGTAVLLSKPRSVQMEGISGDLDLTLPKDCGFRLEHDSASGKLNCDLPVSKNGNTYTYGDGSVDIEVSCISGDVSLRLAQ